MYNAFTPYEQEFRKWKDARAFEDLNPLSRDFLEHITRPDAPKKLWRHQEEAILRSIYAYELLQWKELLLNIVTGGGKTVVIGALIAWLKACHSIHKFVILCPNTIVRDRLEDDFTNGKIFRDFAFLPAGMEHFINELGLHIMQPNAEPQGIRDNGIILGNIQQLYESNINGKRNLSVLMGESESIAVFNDEAHNTPASEYDNTLFKLSKINKFRLDTTATPDRADGRTPDSKMIFEYGIADAQSEQPPIIKSIVVYQPKLSNVELTYTNPTTGEKRTVDEMDEEFQRIESGLSSTQWVTDPDPCRKQIQIALARLKEKQGHAKALANGSYRPILFVVAITIKDAEQARDILEKEFNVKTLLVTEESSEYERKEAKKLGKDGSDYEAVVSVLMLREGWDVPPVSVILLLRKFSSRVYGQQVVGRGLRLNTRTEDTQEYCAIVDHKKLKHDWLWEIVGAKIRDGVDQTSLFGDEDLPPKRKAQTLLNPELLIEVPKPNVDEKIEFDEELMQIKVEMGDYPDWQKILDGFDYSAETEITKVKVAAIESKILDGSGFIEIQEPFLIGGKTLAKVEIPEDSNHLGELLKNSIKDVAADLLAEEGIGSHELGYLYGILIGHVSMRLLNGKTIGTASVQDLMHALNRRHRIATYVKSMPGLVCSMVKYRKEIETVCQ